MKKKMGKINKVIISGGGTGGHIFPAVAIANEIKRRNPNADILFIGAEGKMEMEKVPAAGYPIEGLWISGFQRKFTWSNFMLPFKIIASMWKARSILKQFNPDIVIGVGGYASGPTLKMATQMGIPAVIQEQNSFPGKTNKLLANKVAAICVAYEGLDRFFPKEKLELTGNPVRRDVVDVDGKREEALAFFGLEPNKPVVFVVGGSLGARCLNNAVKSGLNEFYINETQVIWQCGKNNYQALKQELGQNLPKGIVLTDFIARMDFAYAAADIVVSRAGAMAVSELCILGKPIILVPSPYVAEDHQTKNAMALVEKDAALLITEYDTAEKLLPSVFDLLNKKEKMQELAVNIKQLALPRADEDIVDVIQKCIL
jgi:UDP-N-acetylglucosamine--N-acetylmuramyl-(pentapeptide) pyrophosphoryl-undecaprenol N-acetylglucosamine transferase